MNVTIFFVLGPHHHDYLFRKHMTSKSAKKLRVPYLFGISWVQHDLKFFELLDRSSDRCVNNNNAHECFVGDSRPVRQSSFGSFLCPPSQSFFTAGAGFTEGGKYRVRDSKTYLVVVGTLIAARGKKSADD